MKQRDIKNLVCIGVLAFGILLIIASFIVPPLGVVDNSVLTAIGEIFAFAGAYTGVDVIYQRGLMKYGKFGPSKEEHIEESPELS